MTSPPSSEHGHEAIHFPTLRAAITKEHFDLHIAALEWSLDAPITIRDQGDIQSRRNWADKFEPFAHQIQNLITFCRRAPVALLADDVGLGKTISAGLILSELIQRKKVSRALIVAPKLLLPQWREELATKFGIPAEHAAGAQLLVANRGKIPVVITTYQSIRSYLDEVRQSNFDMIILDEAHKLRNLHGTAKSPAFATGIREALKDRVFKYVLMLTATPIQNRLWDLYSLIDLLTVAKGHANPLGTPRDFEQSYLEGSRAVTIQPTKRGEFRQHLSNYLVRTRRTDAKLSFPLREVRTVVLSASSAEQQLLRLVGVLFKDHKLSGLQQSSVGQALMSSPYALAAQLDNMARSGTVPVALAQSVRALATSSLASGKMHGLTNLVKELSLKRPEDWRLVVFTIRAETQEAIKRHLQSMGISVGLIGGSSSLGNQRAIQGFKNSPPAIRVLVSTDAGAEGVNLQAANVLVNFDLPWNPMVLEQRIGRIQRLGSVHRKVEVLNLVLEGSVEEKVVARLGEKLQAISQSLGEIEGILDSATSDEHGEKDGAVSFEDTIRKLVLDSLAGVDVVQATRRALESIDEGKRIYESELETVERTLGDLTSLHRSGPQVPDISPVVPSIPAKDFVLRALVGDGARLQALSADEYSVKQPGRNEYRITFNEDLLDSGGDAGVFGSNAAHLYVPGKPDFERLAQKWVDKANALIVDRSTPRDEVVKRCLWSSLEGMPGIELAEFIVLDRQDAFVGQLTCRASLAVEHDRLEKLVTVPIQTGVFAEVEPTLEEEVVSCEDCSPSQFGEHIRDVVAKAIVDEQDLSKFARFYSQRLAEELQKAPHPGLQDRVRKQFSPRVASDAVGVLGVRYALLQVSTKIRIDGQGPYSADYEFISGPLDRGRVSSTSEWIACQETNRTVPVSATGVCAVSGTRVLLHLLLRSAVSGRLALKKHMVSCELTGAVLLPDELEVCSVSARRVRKDLLETSEVSNRAALPSEYVQCEFTGSRVLPDELIESAVSLKKFRKDQAETSSLSNRIGHMSEFVTSVLPEGRLACDEAFKSDVSGTWGATSLMIQSAMPPGRLGLPSEGVCSEVSGKLVLSDEVQLSEASGKPALPEELETCAFTHARCLPSEIQISEVSRLKFRNDQIGRSSLSGRTGHVTEFRVSVDPDGILAVDEVEQSAVSGQWAQIGRLITSELPPFRRALASEVIASAASGRRFLRNEVLRSSISDSWALPNELATCDFTSARVLPSELIVSDFSGKRSRRDEVLVSVVSGKRGHISEFVHSVAPTGWVAVSEAAQSAFGGGWGAQAMLMPSERPSRRLGFEHEFVTCEHTGRRLLRDEVAASYVSGKLVDDSLLVQSVASDKRAMVHEMGVCELTGRQFISTELGVCAITNRRADPRRMSACPSSKVLYIDDAVSRAHMKKLFGAEMILGRCEWTQRAILAKLLGCCAITGMRVAKSELNSRDELAVMRELVDGGRFAAIQFMAHERIESLRSSRPELKNVVDGNSALSPHGDAVAVCVRCKTGLFGLGNEHIALVVRFSDPPVFLCDPVAGKRTSSGWTRR